jgi:hypothetical protein
MSRGPALRLRLALLASLLGAAAMSLAPAVSSTALAASAPSGLTLTTASTYTLVPDRHVVRVAVNVTALNAKPNRISGGVTTRYFYDSFRLGVQREARSIRATSNGSPLSVQTAPGDGYLRVEVRFRQSLFLNDTANVRVTFELPGGKPRSSSAVRAGPAFATFVAWSFGDRGTVRIQIPGDFETSSVGSDVVRSVTPSATVLSATVSDVPSWYVVVNADRQARLTNVDIRLRGGEELSIHAWPDDPAWKKEVTEVLTDGLPQLVDGTGLAWPVTGPLSITEVHTPLLEGYAGLFFEGTNEIEVSEDLDELTIVHEASHAWFNNDLFRGRWINEGFADTYASETLDRIGAGTWNPGAVQPTDKAAVKLNDWGEAGRISDDEAEAREQFGYDASWTVIRSIVDEIGPSKMRDVLGRAEQRQTPYAGAGSPEVLSTPADWQRLLDLFDEVGGSRSADHLFATWVVSSADAPLLDRRSAARTAYGTLVKAGNGWLPPILVRRPLAAWDFETATSAIADGQAVLGKRDRIAILAGQLSLPIPGQLAAAYQAADASFDDANAIADGVLSDLAALGTATDAVQAPRDPVTAIGLLGSDPNGRLADARAAFTVGSGGASAAAGAVTALITGAADAGRERLVLAFTVVVLLVILGVTLVVARRGQRLRTRARAGAGPGPAAAGSYATLAALPSTEREPSIEPPSRAEPPAPPEPPAHTGDAS